MNKRSTQSLNLTSFYNMTGRSGPLAAVVVAAMLLTTPLPVASQGGTLEEVIVTARYREENLQETPLAITAMTAEELDVRALSSTYEVAYTIPNAVFRPAQNAYGNTMTAFIRGIGQYDFNFAFEPGVGIYIDDVYFPTTMGSMMDLMDLERVEVLRGPQGTLFGRGSIGGAMRLVSKEARGDNTGSIQVTGGSYNRVDVRANYDFAVTDELYARVAGVSKSRDGHQTRLDFACLHPNAAGNIPPRTINRGSDCKLGTLGGEDVQGVRGQLRYVPNDNFDIKVTADYTNDKSEARANTLIDNNVGGPYAVWDNVINRGIYGVNFDDRFVPNDIYVSYATFDDPLNGLNFSPSSTMEQWGVSGDMEWTFSEDMMLKAILAHREYDGYFGEDHDVSPLNDQLVDGIQNFDYFTAEVRLNGMLLQDRLEYTLGYFHYDGHVDSTQTVNFPGLTTAIFGGCYPATCDGTLVVSNNIWDTGSDAVFLHGVYNITDSWTFNAGVRWSDDSKAAMFDNTIVQATLDSSEDRWDYKVGLDWQVTDQIMLYASTATGYRPQAVNPRPFQVTQFLPVDGEEAESYDLGIKGDFFDDTLRLNLAGFYIDYSQRIVSAGGTECTLIPGTTTYATVPAGTPGSVTDSLGNICLNTTSLTRYLNEPGEITGIEAEASWYPTDALTISGGLGYINWDSADPVNPAVDTPVYVPELNWNISASYEYTMENGSTLTPRIDVFGQSTICSSVLTATSCADGYTLVNLRGEWHSPGRDWSVAIGGTNVTDEEYYLNIFDLQAFGQPSTAGQPGRPFEWYLQVRRHF